MTRSAMIIVFAAACASGSPAWGQAPVCSGERIPLDTSIGETPVMTLTLDGHTGGFLLDTGATYSAVDSETFGLPAGGSATLSGFSLPIATGGRFVAEDMGGYRGPAGGQRGRIGTDFLSLGVIEFHYEARPAFAVVGTAVCDPATLRNAGFVEIGLHGDDTTPHRSEPGSPIVPVVGLQIGPVVFPVQMDTGFDDELEPRVVQANGALIAELRAAGVTMHPANGPPTLGCDGRGINEYWQIDTASLTVKTLGGEPVGVYPPPVLQVKTDLACGGIATFDKAFGQLGASWLLRWGTSVFDGPGERVWIRR